jgi:hypothetical protein
MHGVVSFNISIWDCQSNQPLLAGGSTSGIKQKATSGCLMLPCGDCETARWRQKILFCEQMGAFLYDKVLCIRIR